MAVWMWEPLKIDTHPYRPWLVGNVSEGLLCRTAWIQCRECVVCAAKWRTCSTPLTLQDQDDSVVTTWGISTAFICFFVVYCFCLVFFLHQLHHTHARPRAHTHTHTRLSAFFPGLPEWAGTRKVKPISILLKQETVSGSGISWAICKSAPCSRQTTMPAPHCSVFLQAGCYSCRPTNSIKALKAFTSASSLW